MKKTHRGAKSLYRTDKQLRLDGRVSSFGNVTINAPKELPGIHRNHSHYNKMMKDKTGPQAKVTIRFSGDEKVHKLPHVKKLHTPVKVPLPQNGMKISARSKQIIATSGKIENATSLDAVGKFKLVSQIIFIIKDVADWNITDVLANTYGLCRTMEIPLSQEEGIILIVLNTCEYKKQYKYSTRTELFEKVNVFCRQNEFKEFNDDNYPETLKKLEDKHCVKVSNDGDVYLKETVSFVIDHVWE